MKEKIGLLVLLLILSTTMLASFNVTSVTAATPETWMEVTRFTGTGTQTYNTTNFIIGHVEWRIHWSYIPNIIFPALTVFGAMTYPQGSSIPIDIIFQMGSTNTSGTSYIHSTVEELGPFYILVAVANTEGYTIIVEQDIDSAPEFPSLIILPLFMIATLLAVTIYKRKHPV